MQFAQQAHEFRNKTWLGRSSVRSLRAGPKATSPPPYDGGLRFFQEVVKSVQLRLVVSTPVAAAFKN